MKGIVHRQVQRCGSGHMFMWQPGPGWCPYCDLNPEQRAKSMADNSEKPRPCDPGCCEKDKP